MMSQDISEDVFTVLKRSSDLLERLLDQALGGPDSRLSKAIKALSDDEIITLLSAAQNPDDRELDAEAFDIWDEKLGEIE